MERGSSATVLLPGGPRPPTGPCPAHSAGSRRRRMTRSGHRGKEGCCRGTGRDSDDGRDGGLPGRARPGRDRTRRRVPSPRERPCCGGGATPRPRGGEARVALPARPTRPGWPGGPSGRSSPGRGRAATTSTPPCRGLGAHGERAGPRRRPGAGRARAHPARVGPHRGRRRPVPGAAATPAPDHSAEGGRGLALIAALAEAWGCEPLPDGKRVWATIRFASALEAAARAATALAGADSPQASNL